MNSDPAKQIQAAFAPQSPAPGFEIWFAVLIDQRTRQGLWVRYTLFRPAAGCRLPASGMLWASFFDARHPERHLAMARRYELGQIQIQADALIFPDGEIRADRLIGDLDGIKWDLQLAQTFSPLKYAPPLLENLGIAKTKAVIGAPFARAHGSVGAGGRTHDFDAGALLTHIWGSHYLEELYWIFVPGFDGDEQGWALELVSARPKPFLPIFSFAILTYRGKIINNGVFEALGGSVRVSYPEIHFKVRTGVLRLEVDCRLDLAQNTRYLYTNPDGAPRYIAHSDSSEVSCRIWRGSQSTLLSSNCAAVEFHGLRPWDQGAYLDPLASA